MPSHKKPNPDRAKPEPITPETLARYGADFEAGRATAHRVIGDREDKSRWLFCLRNARRQLENWRKPRNGNGGGAQGYARLLGFVEVLGEHAMERADV